MIKYLKEHEIRNVGGSKALFLTEIFNSMDLDFDDTVVVKLEDDVITIEKVKK